MPAAETLGAYGRRWTCVRRILPCIDSAALSSQESAGTT
nr:MAG TPA_asm: hypothetical protein [Bacteriophage sp.]